MEHTLVFPSNAQPETYSNSASHFKTDLHQPLDLSGTWEVALLDMSYVNTLAVLQNESVLLGQTQEKISYVPHLENPKKLIHYDLQDHAMEWSERKLRSKRSATWLEEKRSTIDIQKVFEPSVKGQYKMRAFKHEITYFYKMVQLLSLLNRLGKYVWSFDYDRNRNATFLTFKSETYGQYGLYVSPDLQRILGLKSSLFLPHRSAVSMSLTGCVSLMKNIPVKISTSFPNVINWDNLNLTITLLPLTRMKRSLVRITRGNVADFTSSIIKVKGFEMEERREGVHDIIYNNKLGANDTSFVILNKAAQDYLSLKKNIFWYKDKFSRDKSSFKSFQEGSAIYVFHATLIPKAPNPILWDLKQEVKIPTKRYSNGHDLCEYMNKGDKTKFNYEFTYDERTHKFSVSAKGTTVVKISSNLAEMLGLADHQFLNETAVGKPAELTLNEHHLYIYANFIESTEVGGVRVPLLRYCPIDNANYGQTIYKEFLNKVYIPVNVSRLHHVEFDIYNDSGKRITFTGGRTVLTCHFRKVK